MFLFYKPESQNGALAKKNTPSPEYTFDVCPEDSWLWCSVTSAPSGRDESKRNVGSPNCLIKQHLFSLSSSVGIFWSKRNNTVSRWSYFMSPFKISGCLNSDFSKESPLAAILSDYHAMLPGAALKKNNNIVCNLKKIPIPKCQTIP